MKNKLINVGFLLVVLTSSLRGHNETDFSSVQRRITELYAEYSNGVFSVYAADSSYNDKGELQNRLRGGTGFFISHEGHILTTASIVSNSNRTWITFKGVDYSSELIGVEPSTNLALLKANNLPKNFTYFIPDVNQPLPQIGSQAVMISCPLGFDPTPSLVMMTGSETWLPQKKFDTTHLRINKRVIDGDPGAPVIDLNGRFQGILVRSFPDLASAYVLPAKAVIRVRDDLLFNGKLNTGWIGIEIGVRTTVQDGKQFFLADLIEDSPAAKAALQRNDVLVTIADSNIQSIADIQNAMFFARPGQFLDIQIMRNGSLKHFSVQVEKHPEEQSKEPPAEYTNPSEPVPPAIKTEVSSEEKPT